MTDDWFDFIVELQKMGARFMVVGAHAMAVHGVPRSTQDIDVWVDRSRANSEKVWRATANFGPPVEALHITPDDFAVIDNVIQLGLPPNRIDVLTSLSGLPDFEIAWSNHVERVVRNRPIPFIGRNDLVRNKRATGRHKDLADLEALGALNTDSPRT